MKAGADDNLRGHSHQYATAAVLNGTLGRITLHPPFWFPERLTLEVYGKETTEITLPMNGNGFNHEGGRGGALYQRGSTGKRDHAA